MSQSLTVPSLIPAARVAPSGENDILEILSVCPCNVVRVFPVSTSHKVTFPDVPPKRSTDAEASVAPSGENAIDPALSVALRLNISMSSPVSRFQSLIPRHDPPARTLPSGEKATEKLFPYV